jgi:truncated hemoglobin YjbI
VTKDPLLAPVFKHMGADHPVHVALWLSEVFGGPRDYSEHHGGYPEMLRHHLGKHLTEEMRARWVTLLVQSANEAGLPNDPEFRSVFSAYIEWGSRIAVENSAPGAAPPQAMPMPHWDWHTSAGVPGSRISASNTRDDEQSMADPDLSGVPLASSVDDREPDVVSYERDIKPLLRPGDRKGMLWAFDLWSYEDVAANADRIFPRLDAGTMPPDGAWPRASVDLFNSWITGGKRP